MLKKELKEKTRKNLEFMEQTYLKSNYAFIPMVEAQGKQYGKKLFVSGFINEDSYLKRRFVLEQLGIDLGVRVFLKKEIDTIDGIFMMSEAYMSKHEKGKELAEVSRPSEDPNRQEILMSTGLSRDGIYVLATKIIRKKWHNDKIEVSLEEGEQMESKNNEKEKNIILDHFWDNFKKVEQFAEAMKDDKEIQEKLKNSSAEEISEIFRNGMRLIRALKILKG